MPKSSVPLFISLAFFFLVCQACNLKNEDTSDEVVIISVDNDKLYMKDVKTLFTPDLSVEDSLEIIEHLKTDWIKNRLLLKEAKKETRDKEEIEELVESYRETLILDYYRQDLIKNNLDSVITDLQYSEAYDRYKNNFISPKTFYNIKVVIISTRNPLYEQFTQKWENDIFTGETIDSVCLKGTTQCWVDDDIWLDFNSLINLTGLETLNKNKLKSGYKESFSNNELEVYLYVENIVNPDELLPKAIVKEELREYILNSRKENLLKNTSERLYKKALEENKIKFNL